MGRHRRRSSLPPFDSDGDAHRGTPHQRFSWTNEELNELLDPKMAEQRPKTQRKHGCQKPNDHIKTFAI
jgi:hypothetical protein